MKIDEFNDVLFESTGRKDSAYGGIIGINKELDTSGGYDNSFPVFTPEVTRKERKELADYMIGLWTKYKEAK